MPRKPNHKRLERVLNGPLRPTTKLLLVYYSVLCKGRNYCWPSSTATIKDLHIAGPTISHHLAILCEKGIVYSHPTNGAPSIKFVNPRHPYWSIKDLSKRSDSVLYVPTGLEITDALKVRKDMSEVRLEDMADPEYTLSSIQNSIMMMLNDDK
jgi:hypothetical protein